MEIELSVSLLPDSQLSFQGLSLHCRCRFSLEKWYLPGIVRLRTRMARIRLRQSLACYRYKNIIAALILVPGVFHLAILSQNLRQLVGLVKLFDQLRLECYRLAVFRLGPKSGRSS